MNYITTTLITLAIIATMLLLLISFYALIFIGIPIGIWYVVYVYRTSEDDIFTTKL